MKSKTLIRSFGLAAVLLAAPICAMENWNPLCVPSPGAETGGAVMKTGRPYVFTRGIQPTAHVEATAQAAAQPGNLAMTGRPYVYTRGVRPYATEELTVQTAAESDLINLKATTGRPTAYTRGIRPKVIQGIACPFLFKPRVS